MDCDAYLEVVCSGTGLSQAWPVFETRSSLICSRGKKGASDKEQTASLDEVVNRDGKRSTKKS